MLFTSDECWIQLNGHVNTQNSRVWSSESRNEEVRLYPKKTGVWAALSRQRVIGPVFFNGTLIARRY
ncbi:hypothetical protein ANN_10711 [Periplaneta americana]|uniref:Uncharacterized protein n=1 Tax=Periplaneta americana TaxID=6978 RepID=A0ABQ8T322_PERAM|nr:hypothetical protein ANN_10711 [Periplaneta americana]